MISGATGQPLSHNGAAPVMVPELQIVLMLLWSVAVVVATPATTRMLFGRTSYTKDELPSMMFFVGLVFVGGVWGRYHEVTDETVWTVVYATICAIAVYFLLLMWNRRG